MADPIVGYVTQEQHDAAMLSLRVELSEALSLKQDEIDHLSQQVANAKQIAEAVVAEQITALTAERDSEKSRADAVTVDNAALRESLAGYLLKTDGGQAVLREFERMTLTSNIAAFQARLANLQG